MLHPVAQLEVGGGEVDLVPVGGGNPLVVIAGPCVIESEEGATRICAALRAITSSLGVPFIFKASFDKANRTSLMSFRGPGLVEGLGILAGIRERSPVGRDSWLIRLGPSGWPSVSRPSSPRRSSTRSRIRD